MENNTDRGEWMTAEAVHFAASSANNRGVSAAVTFGQRSHYQSNGQQQQVVFQQFTFE
jgi:hypothetical protein